MESVMSDVIAAKPSTKTRAGISATAATLAGLAAAFGAAACCALPLLFATIGLGTVWIGTVGLLAAPYRSAFLVLGAIGLMGGSLSLWRARRAAICSSGTICINPVLLWLTLSGLLAGATLLYLGYIYV